MSESSRSLGFSSNQVSLAATMAATSPILRPTTSHQSGADSPSADGQKNDTLSRLAYAPATQTTVVTTTTTTFTSFPPLVIKTPRDLRSRDPKQYPLAATPTPLALREFTFDVDGIPAWFQEAEDSETTSHQVSAVAATLTCID